MCTQKADDLSSWIIPALAHVLRTHYDVISRCRWTRGHWDWGKNWIYVWVFECQYYFECLAFGITTNLKRRFLKTCVVLCVCVCTIVLWIKYILQLHSINNKFNNELTIQLTVSLVQRLTYDRSRCLMFNLGPLSQREFRDCLGEHIKLLILHLSRSRS